jgi:prevent-host-death family protein
VFYGRLTNLVNAAHSSSMRKFINLYEAKTRLSELVDRAAAGDEIVIAKAGKPVARLVPLQLPTRKPGRGRGKIRVAPDFDAPLPAALLREFGFED